MNNKTNFSMGVGVIRQSHFDLADIKRCSFLYCELDARACFGSPALAHLEFGVESRPAHINHNEVVLKEIDAPRRGWSER